MEVERKERKILARGHQGRFLLLFKLMQIPDLNRNDKLLTVVVIDSQTVC